MIAALRAGARASALLALLALVLSAVACDPCSGLASCNGDPTLALTGQFVVRGTGRPVSGVRVDVVPVAGATGGSATTGSDGFWQLELPATATGDVTVDVQVTPPSPYPSYRVPAVHASASTRRGEGNVLGRWVVDPYVNYLAEIRSRFGGFGVYGATVHFMRTGGVAATPNSVDRITDEAGRFGFELAPNGGTLGDVIGDLYVVKPGLTSGTWIRGARIPVVYRDDPLAVQGVFPIGFFLTYVAEIYDRGTGRPLANADIQFVRTSGIAISPSTVVRHTDASGRTLLDLTPSAEGEVVGDISFVRPGSTTPVVLRGVRLTTYDSLETRLLRLGFGDRLAYAGELQFRGTHARAANVPVEFRRTGGIQVETPVLRSTTDVNGRFPIITATSESGELVGDLVVDPAGPLQQTYTGIRLATFPSDEVRFAGVWGVGDQILYAGEFFNRATGQRQAGIDVEFRRTGGVNVTQPVFTSRTDANGRFLIAPPTQESGEVVGELRARTPSGFVTVVPNVHLKTQRDDSLRLAGVWGFGPSLLYAGEILNAANDRPVAGAHVTFERTGGIAVSPARIDATTDANGRFPLIMTTADSGSVIGTLTVRPPAPWADAPIVYPNVSITTFDSDELRLFGVWRIPPPPAVRAP
ncbi:hypothetical protein J421_3484 [Gemmatirosa kalamazoonensis]|uniref:Carboxypeptidase regulatory-like domain-containing protein n=1 Tax=Gemmatirosa kalamazoonensis TaxID=861299 RepID=W0RJR5_9BACT|nr:sedoheptulose 7-phosphate cyclase [Gemmatirosa kalamazoonensis]AHG91021.1 hypothetical protein J421_3484 [Gemmatirosa kalamazoonensis]